MAVKPVKNTSPASQKREILVNLVLKTDLRRVFGRLVFASGAFFLPDALLCFLLVALLVAAKISAPTKSWVVLFIENVASKTSRALLGSTQGLQPGHGLDHFQGHAQLIVPFQHFLHLGFGKNRDLQLLLAYLQMPGQIAFPNDLHP